MLQERTIHIAHKGTRRQIRERVIREFLKEHPGSGKKELASRYTYLAESLGDGKQVLLKRPTFKHGFDFVVRVPEINFGMGQKRRRYNPSHKDMINDLENKRALNPGLYV